MSESVVALKQRPLSCIAILGLSIRVHWPFFTLALCYFLTNQLMFIGLSTGHEASISGLLAGFLSFGLPAGLVAVVLFRLVIQYPLVLKPASPLKQMGREIVALVKHPVWLLTGLPILSASILFNESMLKLKPLIPVLKPFSWDQSFMQLDRFVHFGFDPWVVLQPLLGFDAITFVIGFLYNFWFLGLFGTFIWFGFSKTVSVLRVQFFVADMLTWWIGGGLLAVYFSSAGPAFYSNIGLSPDPFLPLMDYIRDVNSRLPIWALETQQFLWEGYTGKTVAVGISAFPSMHNASATLFALAAWRLSRKAGLFFGLYGIVILLGSVHLGWHYAVDGYAGIALAATCWWLAGKFARWHATLPSTQKLNAALAAI